MNIKTKTSNYHSIPFLSLFLKKKTQMEEKIPQFELVTHNHRESKALQLCKKGKGVQISDAQLKSLPGCQLFSEFIPISNTLTHHLPKTLHVYHGMKTLYTPTNLT
jgi:hypothetical protein